MQSTLQRESKVPEAVSGRRMTNPMLQLWWASYGALHARSSQRQHPGFGQELVLLTPGCSQTSMGGPCGICESLGFGLRLALSCLDVPQRSSESVLGPILWSHACWTDVGSSTSLYSAALNVARSCAIGTQLLIHVRSGRRVWLWGGLPPLGLCV